MTKSTDDIFYQAHLSRDSRFDGKFFVAVKTTKIYCRPICPARKAKRENVEFFTHATQAEAAGYRPCLRCHPESAPGSADWLGTSAILPRALRLMEQVAADELSVQALAVRLGISERWLRELFQQQLYPCYFKMLVFGVDICPAFPLLSLAISTDMTHSRRKNAEQISLPKIKHFEVAWV